MSVKVLVSLVLVILVTCSASEDIYTSCGDSLNCAEDRLIQIVDLIDAKEKIEIFDDSITLEKTKEVVQGRQNEDIFDRVGRFMASHELKIKIPDSEARSMEARKSKLKRLILPLLLALKLKAAIIIPAVLSLIGLISFKGLGASIMALTIAGAVGLKNLLEHHGPKVSYEVVPQIHAPLWNRAGIESYPMGPGYHTIP